MEKLIQGKDAPSQTELNAPSFQSNLWTKHAKNESPSFPDAAITTSKIKILGSKNYLHKKMCPPRES